jgi:hypothetical protein
VLIVPIFIKDAKQFIAKHHRHNRPSLSGLFACAVADHLGGEIRGVAIAGRPVARLLDDGFTVEVTRLGTDGIRNGCSMLYGAITRAAKALGYRLAYTYTLASEPGSSLLASGWILDTELSANPTWDTPSRRRVQTDLFGEETRPSGPKKRWKRILIPNLESVHSDTLRRIES